MKKCIFKDWINAIRFPLPVDWAPSELWDEFIENATYSRLSETFYEYEGRFSGYTRRKNLCRIVAKLAKGGWFRLSSRFVINHANKVVKIDSFEDIKDNLRDYEANRLRYLIDKDNSVIGIIVDKDTIITGYLSVIDERVAKVVMEADVLPTKEQIQKIYSNRVLIAEMMRVSGFAYVTNAWIDDNGSLLVSGEGGYFRPVLKNRDDFASAILVFRI